MITNASEILESVQLLDIVKEHTEIKAKGANYIGCCPFHSEKTPSFSVSPSKGIYKCFGCGKGGNSAASFLMELKGINYPEALRLLAKTAKIEVKESGGTYETDTDYAAKETAFLALEATQAVFATATGKDADAARKYWTDRGFSDETLDTFGVGYCDGTKPEHVDMTDTGIVNPAGNLIFYKRTTIPVHNRQGRVVAYGARVVFAEGDKEKQAKYINSGDSIVYKKEKSLFNLHRADKHIRTEQAIYIVEGYADCMAAWQMEKKNVIALCGSALTDGQLAILKKYNGDKPLKIIIALDNELRGSERKEQIYKSFEHILASCLPFADVRLLNYGGKTKDLGDFLEKGMKIENTREEDALDFWLKTIVTEDFVKSATINEWAAVQERFARLLGKVSKKNVRDMYIKDSAESLNTTIKNLDQLVKEHLEVKVQTLKKDAPHVKVGDYFYERQPQLLVKHMDDPSLPAAMIYVQRKEGELKREYGDYYLKQLPKYDNWIIAPEHVKYTREIEYAHPERIFKYFNRYAPLPNVPIAFDIPEEALKSHDYSGIKQIERIAKMVKHIANASANGPHFERLIWDYIAILYLHPRRRQRALILTSKDEGTGKSTFARLLSELFGDNSVMTESSRITSNFNSQFSGKLVAVIEETKDDRSSLAEVFKNLIAAHKLTIERKGVDSSQEESFCKYIILSNYPETLMKVSGDSTRFIVCVVPPIRDKSGTFEDDVLFEVPYLMHFLKVRGVHYASEDRFWHAQHLVENAALNKLRQASKDVIHKNIEDLMASFFIKTNYPNPIASISSAYLRDMMIAYGGEMYKGKSPNYFQSVCEQDLRLIYCPQKRFKQPILEDMNTKAWITSDIWAYDDRPDRGKPIEFPIWRFLTTTEIVENYTPQARLDLCFNLNAQGDELKKLYPKFDLVQFIKAIEPTTPF